MSVADRIAEQLGRLPSTMQAEVLDYVESLVARVERDENGHTDRTWSTLSLESAMRGMEDEDGPTYTDADLTDRFA